MRYCFNRIEYSCNINSSSNIQLCNRLPFPIPFQLDRLIFEKVNKIIDLLRCLTSSIIPEQTSILLFNGPMNESSKVCSRRSIRETFSQAFLLVSLQPQELLYSICMSGCCLNRKYFLISSKYLS
jgi:hypothetical protein